MEARCGEERAGGEPRRVAVWAALAVGVVTAPGGGWIGGGAKHDASPTRSSAAWAGENEGVRSVSSVRASSHDSISDNIYTFCW